MKNSLFPVFSVAVALVSFAPAEVRAAAAGLAVSAPDPSLEVGNRKPGGDGGASSTNGALDRPCNPRPC